MQVVPQNVGVSTLGSSRHCLSYERERLVPVKAAQLHDFAVELETVVRKLGFAEAEAARVLVYQLVAPNQPNTDVVKIPVLKIPELDSWKIGEVDDD
jgi:hypothetical protein